jgi:hypothetical protein
MYIILKTSRTFRNEKRECMKDKINEPETNNKNKNIRDLYRDIMNLRKVTDLELILSRMRMVICSQIPTLF